MAKSFNARMAARFVLIAAGYDKANQMVHETALEIIDHVTTIDADGNMCGDCSTAQGLVMALPASVRRETLISWFTRYTPIVVKNSETWNAKMHPVESKLYVPFNREEAAATPFYVIAKQDKEPASSLDAEGILKLITRLAATLEKKVSDGLVLPEFMDSATAASAALKRIRIKSNAPANDEGAPSSEAAAA